MSGYRGNGFTCQPICNGTCQNGGRCVAPDVCACSHGYIGPNCELDIDECSLGISACRGNSACINTPGWYHCDCLEGYHSNWPDNHYGSLCLDRNECLGQGEGHTCHPSTQCVNTEGGYVCECQNNEQCVKTCMAESSEHEDGSEWTSVMDKCLHCVCKEGITECHKGACNCSDEDVDLDCCPHCDESAKCDHEETALTFLNGEQWQYQCETCECLKGEVDCWPVTCPRKPCVNSIQEPGDCCPRCVDDNPCRDPAPEIGGADLSNVVCHYNGLVKFHGDAWYLDDDPCTQCECKTGHICCSFTQGCKKGKILSTAQGFSLSPDRAFP